MAENSQPFVECFLSGLSQVLGKPSAGIPLHEPEFSGNEWAYVKECLNTGWVSSVGKYVDEFELRLAEYTGARHAVVVVNGTAALHVALKLAGVQPNDEVIVPALSFVATANAVAHCSAIPHFVDSAPDTLGIDPVALDVHLARIAEPAANGLRNRETGRRIAAIVPMHVFGHPVALAPLLDLAGRYGLPVIEDAAESLGSFYQGQHTGTFGKMGVLSFNGNKIITTGGGGAILTNNSELARHAKHLTTTAKRPHRWEFFHDEVAWNYRLPNLNAALGCAQLECLPDFLARKRELAAWYRTIFSAMDGMCFVSESADSHSNYWLNAVRLNYPDMILRNQLLAAANDAGYQCRPAWTLLHTLPMFGECPHAPLSVAEQLSASLINLPSSAGLVMHRIESRS
ncbi:MAG: LegC family aminotransferase [Sulfuricellaceae bacterium]